MQYNFPLLAGQPEQWQGRLLEAVEAQAGQGFGALRPTFLAPVPELVDLAAAWLRLPPGQLTMTSGAHHGSLCAMMAAGVTGKAVAVDAAAYSGAMFQARALGCPVVGCAVDAEGMTPESLRAVCERGRAAGVPVGAVFLTPTVHNPLGMTVGLARREALVAMARAFDVLLIEDDTYGFLETEPPPRLWDLAPERTFYVNTLSKCLAPAARTGFLAAPERFRAAVATAVKNTATGTSALHQRAAGSMLADGSVGRLIEAKRAEGARRNQAARAVLGERCRPGAACAWHVWVALPADVRPETFEARMAAWGVAVSGGNWFAAAEGAPRGFRLALGGEVDGARVQHGVELVAEELAALAEVGL